MNSRNRDGSTARIDRNLLAGLRLGGRLRRYALESMQAIYRLGFLGIGERMAFEPELIPVRVTAAGSIMRGGNAVSRDVDVPGFTYGPSR